MRWLAALPLTACLATVVPKDPAGVRYEGDATLVSAVADDPPAECPNGGVRVDSGLDRNGNRLLDADEAEVTTVACNGSTALIRGTPATSCDGVTVESGVDANGDGALDAAEITSTTVLCRGEDGAGGKNGAPGADGSDGATGPTGPMGPTGTTGGAGATGAAGNTGSTGARTLSRITAAPKGPGCVRGGARFESGVDDNGDGVLAAGEVDATQTVCTESPRPRFLYTAEQAGNEGVAATLLDPSTSGWTADIALDDGAAFGSGDPFTITATDDTVYVASYNATNQLHALRINRPSGRLQEIVGSPYTSPALLRLVADPEGRTIFGGAPDNNVYAWPIDPQSGGLLAAQSVTMPGSVTAMAFSAAHNKLFAVAADNLRAISVSVTGALSVDATSAIVTASADSQALVVLELQSGTYLYVTSRSSDGVHAYVYDGATLTAHATTPFVSLGAGTNPGAIAADPLGQHLYVGQEAAGTVRTLSVDPATGALTLNATVRGSCGYPNGMAVDPAYRMLYVVCYVGGGAKMAMHALDAAGLPGAAVFNVSGQPRRDIVIVEE